MLAVVARSAGSYLEKPADVVRGQAARLPWAWHGLCFGVPFVETSREGYRDIVNNAPISSINGTPTWVRDSRGNPAVEMNVSSASWVGYADHPRHDRPSTELTVYARFRRTTDSQADGGYFVNVYSIGTPWKTWGISTDSANTGKMQASISMGSTPTFIGDTGVMPTTEYISAFFRWRTGSEPRLDIFGERGNVLSSLVHGSTVSGTIGYAASQGLRLNSNEGGTRGGARYSQAMVWSRRLTDTEVAALTMDPFGWYAPRRESVPIAGPFPVGPGMAALGMVYGGP